MSLPTIALSGLAAAAVLYRLASCGTSNHDAAEGSVDANLEEIVLRRHQEASLHDHETCWQCVDAVHRERELIVNTTGEVGDFRCFQKLWHGTCCLCAKAMYGQTDNVYANAHAECALRHFETVYGPSHQWRKCFCDAYCNKYGKAIRGPAVDAYVEDFIGAEQVSSNAVVDGLVKALTRTEHWVGHYTYNNN